MQTHFKAEYIGDGVYATFDGHHTCLRLGNHGAPIVVFLEPGLAQKLADYDLRVRKQMQEIADAKITERNSDGHQD